MTMTRSGIPTTYHGTNFRSRLEARWAAFFDLVDWSWTYEPFDTGRWIPDFLISGPAAFLVEVGPCVSEADYIEKAAKPEGYVEQITLVLGATVLAAGDTIHERAGWLTSDDWGSDPDFARWASCRICGDLGVYHASGSYRLLPCGHHEGDNHLDEASPRWLAARWHEAGNLVQWQPR